MVSATDSLMMRIDIASKFEELPHRYVSVLCDDATER
jgi:hypothetical protein